MVISSWLTCASSPSCRTYNSTIVLSKQNHPQSSVTGRVAGFRIQRSKERFFLTYRRIVYEAGRTQFCWRAPRNSFFFASLATGFLVRLSLYISISIYIYNIYLSIYLSLSLSLPFFRNSFARASLSSVGEVMSETCLVFWNCARFVYAPSDSCGRKMCRSNVPRKKKYNSINTERSRDALWLAGRGFQRFMSRCARLLCLPRLICEAARRRANSALHLICDALLVM